ncbi:MAG: pyridoxal-phosphate dependent enzyme [Desulfurococcaceae archaeon]|uniref:Pyridoxal-phosphate dependent enzyme n=1 Tax=Staphylothermus marinus TaxID=2280 RepID=A0A7C4HDP5_STAMA
MSEISNPFWKCIYCGFNESIWSNYYWKCPRCGKPLVINYSKVYEPKGRGIFRYSKTLPFTPEKTRGEGSTPLVVEKQGFNTLLFKLEYLNPTGSFKDRGSALAIYYGYRMNYKRVVEDTSGNTGISVTLYSKLYGLKPVIYMPRTAPLGKKRLISKLGGEIVETIDRSEASIKVLENTFQSYYVAHTWNYLYVIGASTIAYEVFDEYGVPDYVIVPVGSGGLILGLISGFEYLFETGLADRMPRFIAVQGYSVQPVFSSIKGYSIEGEDSDLADGIMVPNPPRLIEIVDYLKKYGEEVVLICNNEIARAVNELHDMGFIVEPTSASAWAGYLKIRDRLKGSVLIPLTGSGLKTIAHEP